MSRVVRCPRCGADEVRMSFRFFRMFRGPNLTCHCGHSWRATLDDVRSVQKRADEAGAAASREAAEAVKSRPWSWFGGR